RDRTVTGVQTCALPILHDIGTFEVKHGARVSVTNLYSDEVGNPNLPSKLQAFKKHHARVRWAAVAIGLLVVAALGAVVLSFLRRSEERRVGSDYRARRG